MIVQVAGPACEICDRTVLLIEQIIAARGLDREVQRITDFDAVVALGVYAIPGIIVDGVLKSVGRIPDQSEITRWLVTGDN